MDQPNLINPQLEGEPFLLEAGSTGVLLLHGLTATPAEVRRLARNLHRAGFTVSGPLLPGHCATPAALNRVRWQDWYQAAENAYAGLAGRCKRVFAGGESMGGLLALLLAARHPEAAGVLAYSPALELRGPAWQKTLLPLLAQFIPSMPKTDLAGNTTWQGYPVNPLKSVVQIRRLESVVRRELSSVTQPLLVVQGRQDRTIDLNSAEQVYQGAKSAKKELHWMEKSGHCVLLDDELPQVTLLTLNFLYKYQ